MTSIPVSGSSAIEQGDWVAVDVTGYAVTGSNVAAYVGMGVAANDADNSAGSAGAIDVKVYIGGEVAVQGNFTGSVTRKDRGKRLSILNATQVGLSGTAGIDKGVSCAVVSEPHADLSNTVWALLTPKKTNPDTDI